MKKYLLIIIPLFYFNAYAQSTQELIQLVWKGVGGKTAFEKSCFIEFKFEVVRSEKLLASNYHLWNRYTGDYRLEYTIGKDSTITALFNTNTQKGKVYLNSKEIKDSVKKSNYLKEAYESFINDTYWLMVPTKLEDQGVNVNAGKDTTINNQLYKTLYLNFNQGVGITSKDEYWLYIHPTTGEIGYWKYELEGRKGKPRLLKWESYKDLGNGFKLSTKKTSTDGVFQILLTDAKVLEKVSIKRFIKR